MPGRVSQKQFNKYIVICFTVSYATRLAQIDEKCKLCWFPDVFSSVTWSHQVRVMKSIRIPDIGNELHNYTKGFLIDISFHFTSSHTRPLRNYYAKDIIITLFYNIIWNNIWRKLILFQWLISYNYLFICKQNKQNTAGKRIKTCVQDIQFKKRGTMYIKRGA